MKCIEASLKSYSSAPAWPTCTFENPVATVVTRQYLLLIVPIILMKKTSFSPLTSFLFLQGEKNALKLHKALSLSHSFSTQLSSLADLWWKMSQLMFGYTTIPLQFIVSVGWTWLLSLSLLNFMAKSKPQFAFGSITKKVVHYFSRMYGMHKTPTSMFDLLFWWGQVYDTWQCSIQPTCILPKVGIFLSTTWLSFFKMHFFKERNRKEYVITRLRKTIEWKRVSNSIAVASDSWAINIELKLQCS